MGGDTPKPLLPLNADQTILAKTLKALIRAECFESVVVLAPADHIDRFRRECGLADPKISVIEGGATRQESVRIGLQFIENTLTPNSNAVVAIHDAARCNVSVELIKDVVYGALEFGAAIPAVPVVDALIRAEQEGVVKEYVPREDVWAVQTPQAFRFIDILEAHNAAFEQKISVVDDASLMSLIKRTVKVVKGDVHNIKITTPEDYERITS